MKRIDRQTVQRIIEAADIVDVVSDFVSLKRSGANYKGLCPFHNDRTPSFHVSKAKNLCKCFSCGKGGSPVGFIMEHEQMTYNEALRYLAKKYNIEIVEHEMSDEERERENERESMLAINEFALSHFENNLTSTPDGQAIALSYFRERGLSDAMIKKFRLGYSLDQRDVLYNSAIKQGYNEKFLFSTGLCGKSEKGSVYDRYKGRVIFPIFGISGKPIAFGGRILSNRKDIAKYVNSPESIIYHKSDVLYGLYQAKQTITRHNKCILVEGYMDVISMYQSGIENVVASSGTALTEGQIRLIHRFTENVTVIYDGDEAGIKASMRGIDMLLKEGLNIKVLLLPDGEDPDSFARTHSAQELVDYINQNETDFIRFKTSILLKGVEHDPIARSNAIKDILRSIAVIPDMITRSEYVKECSRMLETDEKTLTKSLNKLLAEIVEKDATKAKVDYTHASIEDIEEEVSELTAQANTGETFSQQPQPTVGQTSQDKATYLAKYEHQVIKYIVRYGVVDFCDEVDENGQTQPLKVIDYIQRELECDEITFSNSIYNEIYNEAIMMRVNSWQEDFQRHEEKLTERRQKALKDGTEEIYHTAQDSSSIRALEQSLLARIDQDYIDGIISFNSQYISSALLSSENNEIRHLSTEMVSERYELSKVHTKYAKIETEIERLTELVPRAITEWKDAILDCEIKSIQQELDLISKQHQYDGPRIMELMTRQVELNDIKKELAKAIGDRIVTPRK